MNGVTGRMGGNQHLVRSIAAIRAAGGVPASDGEVIWPDPILVGRDAAKLAAPATPHSGERWSTDLEACLANPHDTIYFDAQSTPRRAAAITQAIAAGKHVYCEKPVAEDLSAATELARLAGERGVVNGVVQDKLFLPGLLKLRRLRDQGFFGRILSVRGEFGYWVFEGDGAGLAQRPSWNYRREDGGGIILDMFCHWRYVLDEVVAPVRSVCALGVTHVPFRFDEEGTKYRATADDSAYATFELEGAVVAQVNSSWDVRVYRDELFTLQVDGTDGSAVAGLWGCKAQARNETPVLTWNPDLPSDDDYRAGWSEVKGAGPYPNCFRAQWELFLKSVATGESFPWGLLQGAKGVQLAELGLQSSQERCWADVPELKL